MSRNFISCLSAGELRTQFLVTLSQKIGVFPNSNRFRTPGCKCLGQRARNLDSKVGPRRWAVLNPSFLSWRKQSLVWKNGRDWQARAPSSQSHWASCCYELSGRGKGLVLRKVNPRRRAAALLDLKQILASFYSWERNTPPCSAWRPCHSAFPPQFGARVYPGS